MQKFGGSLEFLAPNKANFQLSKPDTSNLAQPLLCSGYGITIPGSCWLAPKLSYPPRCVDHKEHVKWGTKLRTRDEEEEQEEAIFLGCGAQWEAGGDVGGRRRDLSREIECRHGRFVLLPCATSGAVATTI